MKTKKEIKHEKPGWVIQTILSSMKLIAKMVGWKLYGDRKMAEQVSNDIERTKRKNQRIEKYINKKQLGENKMEKTISEAISLAKQKENEIFRLNKLKKSILQKGFTLNEFVASGGEVSAEEYNEAKKEYIETTREKIEEIDEKLGKLLDEVITIRNLINKKNIELGLDEYLIKMKWLRINLDNLMSQSNLKETSSIYDEAMDVNIYSNLGLGKKISELESKKAKLDSKIQQLNLNNTVELPDSLSQRD